MREREKNTREGVGGVGGEGGEREDKETEKGRETDKSEEKRLLFVHERQSKWTKTKLLLCAQKEERKGKDKNKIKII